MVNIVVTDFFLISEGPLSEVLLYIDGSPPSMFG